MSRFYRKVDELAVDRIHKESSSRAPVLHRLSNPLILYGVVSIAALSGSASLIYQINWQRQLTTIFGLAHYATTIVILIFFLGFALGSYFAKRYADRFRNILILIIILETIIATFGALSFNAFDVIREANIVLGSVVGESRQALLGGRALLCLVILALPTVCMGATLPCFYKACIKSMSTRGAWMGLVTCANTMGAVIGAMITTVWLMGQFHGQTQMYIACSLNVIGVVIAICLSRNTALSTSPSYSATERTQDSDNAATRSLSYAFMLSGAASLSLEIIWNRLAYMSLEHTIYTFASILSVYLMAYAIGALLASLWLRNHIPKRNGIATLLFCSLLSTMVGFMAFTARLHYSTFEGLLGYQASALLIASIYAFLPMFFMGLAMPQTLYLLSGNLKHVSKDTGHALMLNNIGSIAAIIIVGFFLIPLTNLYVVSLFCTLLLFGAILLTLDPKAPREANFSRYGLAATLLLWLLVYPPIPQSAWNTINGHKALWSAEDESGQWNVVRKSTRDGGSFVLYLNDYYENFLSIPAKGTIEGDFLVSAMVKPKIQTAYSIGLGFALEAYEILRFPEVERFDTAEISPGVVTLARKTWSQLGDGPFKDSRFKILPDDGRLVLEHSPLTYDLIFSGTTRSSDPGSTNLFSIEYFTLLKRKLNAGGLTQQWVPRSPSFSSIMIVKTFLSVFPDALLVSYSQPGRSSAYLYLLGFKDGVPENFEHQVREAFARGSKIFKTTVIRSPQQFTARLMIPKREKIQQLDIPIITDDLPIIEYGRDFKESENWDETHEFAKRYSTSPFE